MDTHTFLKNQEPKKSKPGLKLIIMGGVIALCGALVIPAILMFSRFPSDSDNRQFNVPASFSIEVNKPGDYFLWNHTQFFQNGVTFSLSKELPEEFVITISDQDNKPLRLVRDQSYTVSINGNKKSSIGYVRVSDTSDRPTKLNFKVEGSTHRRYFSVSQFNFSSVLGLSLGIIAILLVIVGIGAAFIIRGAKQVLVASQAKSSTPSSV